jgi:hypothetical protein
MPDTVVFIKPQEHRLPTPPDDAEPLNKIFRRLALAVFLAFFIASAWFAHAVLVRGNTFIISEFGPLENAQGWVLLASCLLFLWPVLQRRPDRVVAAFCSLLCLTLLLREVNVERLNLPGLLIFLGSGSGRNVMLVVLFLMLSAWALLTFSHTFDAALRFFRSLPGALLIAAAGCELAGNVFNAAMRFPRNVFFEETSELAAYCLLLLCAVATGRQRMPSLRRSAERSG